VSGLLTQDTSGSSSASSGADQNPVLLVSGGSWGGGIKTGSGTYNDPGFVPIGAMVSVSASFPNTNTPQQVTWKGGTPYSSYPLGSAVSTAPTSMAPGQNVQNTGFVYTFLVDSKPRTYSIAASAAAGSSTITFTTYGPTGTLTQVPTGSSPNFNQNTTGVTGEPNVTQIAYNNPNANPNTSLGNAGMYLKGSVQPSAQVGGKLMFLQTITAYRTLAAPGRGTVNWSGNGQTAVDNGGTPPPNGGSGGYSVGYPTTDSNFTTRIYVTSWDCPINGPVADRYMIDSPFITATSSAGPTLLQVGATPTGANPIPESFSTYIMFLADGNSNVWVPIAQTNWSWSLTANNGGGGWNTSNGTSPGAASPAGGSPPMGPTWGGSFSTGHF